MHSAGCPSPPCRAECTVPLVAVICAPQRCDEAVAADHFDLRGLNLFPAATESTALRTKSSNATLQPGWAGRDRSRCRWQADRSAAYAPADRKGLLSECDDNTERLAYLLFTVAAADRRMSLAFRDE